MTHSILALTSASEIRLLSRTPPRSPPLETSAAPASPASPSPPSRRSLLTRFLKRPSTSPNLKTIPLHPNHPTPSHLPELSPKVLQRVILDVWCSDLTEDERYRLYASSMHVSKAWRSLFLRVSSMHVYINNTFDYVRFRLDGYIRQPRLELMALAQHQNYLRSTSRLVYSAPPTLPTPAALPPPKALCQSVTLTASYDSPIHTPTIYDIYGYSTNALSHFLSDGTGVPLRNLHILNLRFINAGLHHVMEALTPGIPPQVTEVCITWTFEDPHRRTKRITALEQPLVPTIDDDTMKIPRGAVCFPSAWAGWPGVKKLSFEDGTTAGLIGGIVSRCPDVEEVSFEGRPEVRNSSSARMNTGEWMKFFHEKKPGEEIPKEKLTTWFHEAPIIRIRRVKGYGADWEGRLRLVQREHGGVLRRTYQHIN